MASFLIRFQLHLADIFARSFSYSSSEKEKRSGRGKERRSGEGEGKKKNRPLREVVFRSFAPSSSSLPVSLSTAAIISTFPPSPPASTRSRYRAANSTLEIRWNFFNFFFFFSFLSPLTVPSFFSVSLLTIDFQLFRVNATRHRQTGNQAIVNRWIFRPDLPNSTAISIYLL